MAYGIVIPGVYDGFRKGARGAQGTTRKGVKMESNQVIVTLPDGSQVAIMGLDLVKGVAHVITRSSAGACWDAPLPIANPAGAGTAHVPGTYHVGEW